MKVLIATDKPFAKVAVDGIRDIVEKAGLELVLLEKYTEKSQLKDAVSLVDAMIVRSDIIDADVIDSAKNLKLIVRAGAGYDNIDLKAATAKNIVVMNTPGQNANAVAELVLAMMVMMARNMFDGSTGTELKGKSLGLHAYGNVSRNVARVAKGFDMKVYAYDPYTKADLMAKDGVTYLASLDELYTTCQYVSLHIPATPETEKSINFDLLNKMPKGATLLNTARKEVIDEQGILKMFESRPDFKYASDIVPSNAELIKEKFAGRCFFTPKKMGAQTQEANINAGLAAAHQIVAFLIDGMDKYRVN